jgi:hypothetical protein
MLRNKVLLLGWVFLFHGRTCRVHIFLKSNAALVVTIKENVLHAESNEAS